MSEKSALELELDINEIQELQTMCTLPVVRNILASIIVQFETLRNKTHERQKRNTEDERRWSDIVARRNPRTSENGSAAIYYTETVITSRSPHPYEGNCEMETRHQHCARCDR